jgi:hypothetical protein
MGLTNYETKRPILITGKPGFGKTTKALSMLDEPLIMFANEVDTTDIQSMPRRRGILIEDVHHKPRKEDILYIIRNFRGQIVLTSIDEKSVPKEIKAMCQIKRAGRTNYLRDSVMDIAPNSVHPQPAEMDTFSLVMDYLKNRNRDEVADRLKYNKPSDTQILSWLSENMHPNRLLFVDGVVKRRWSSNYFYELLAYAFEGNMAGRVQFPKRNAYSKVPYICRKLGVRDERVLKQLLKDEDFKKWATKKLNNSECRIIGIGEKRRRKKTDPVVYDVGSLEQFM